MDPFFVFLYYLEDTLYITFIFSNSVTVKTAQWTDKSSDQCCNDISP